MDNLGLTYLSSGCTNLNLLHKFSLILLDIINLHVGLPGPILTDPVSDRGLSGKDDLFHLNFSVYALNSCLQRFQEAGLANAPVSMRNHKLYGHAPILADQTYMQ